MGRIVAALIFAFLALPAFAQEVIRNFETAIVVNADASVTITETITVTVEGRQIQRGIFRDIPTALVSPDGRRIVSALNVLDVSRNGAPEPYAEEWINGGTRIRIGDANVLLPHGVQRYQIRYTMDRATRMFEDFDEIYWNATGNFWQFPIEQATAVVTLPEGADIRDTSVYTGAQGATAGEASIERLSRNQVRFILARPLGPYEGMTVSVAFDKGVLVEPQGTDALWYWFSDYRNYVVPAILLAIVLAYNLLAWTAVGRDPAKGVIIPRFHAPKGFSPALTHYVHRMGWQNNGWLAFSSALVSLAVKGLIEIETQGKTTTLRRTDKPLDGKSNLPPGEMVLYNWLTGQGTVTIDKKTGPSINLVRGNFIATLEGENRTVYFNNHVIYVVFGILLAVLSIATMTLLGILNFEFVFFSAFAAVFISMFGIGLRSLWQGPGIGRVISVGIAAIFVFNFSFVLLDAFVIDWLDFPFMATISIILISLVFGILMRAPTVHGRALMDEIDGFKMYLETAEKERLNFRGEPEMTVERFERILPYAMAMGVERPWSERFQNDLARHAIKDAPETYRPRWYGSSSFSPSTLSRSIGSIASGLSSAMISSQPSSSSSSGSGGGGSSGGGGGGGGGGGW